MNHERRRREKGKNKRQLVDAGRRGSVVYLINGETPCEGWGGGVRQRVRTGCDWRGAHCFSSSSLSLYPLLSHTRVNYCTDTLTLGELARFWKLAI